MLLELPHGIPELGKTASKQVFACAVGSARRFGLIRTYLM